MYVRAAVSSLPLMWTLTQQARVNVHSDKERIVTHFDSHRQSFVISSIEFSERTREGSLPNETKLPLEAKGIRLKHPRRHAPSPDGLYSERPIKRDSTGRAPS